MTCVPATLRRGWYGLLARKSTRKMRVPQFGHALFLGCFLFFTVGPLNPKLLQTVLQRAERQAEQLGGFRSVVVSRIHRLQDQVLFDFFEIDSFGGQFETTGHGAL